MPFSRRFAFLSVLSGFFSVLAVLFFSPAASANSLPWVEHSVRSGESVAFIAGRYGVSPRTIERANELLKVLERSHSNDELAKMAKEIGASDKDQFQLSFIQLDDPLLEQIKQDILHTDIDNLTPVEALMKLHTIRKRLSGG